jgi:hypothetical protein
MGMQPMARRPGTKPAFLARPKHGMAWYCAGPGRHSPMHQTVPGPLPKHAGWHGTARYLKTGPVAAR